MKHNLRHINDAPIDKPFIAYKTDGDTVIAKYGDSNQPDNLPWVSESRGFGNEDFIAWQPLPDLYMNRGDL